MMDEVMRRFKAEGANRELSAYIADHLEANVSVKQDLRALDAAYREAKEHLEKVLAENEAARAKVQERCPHLIVNYHPDPVESSGTYWDCSICGKVWDSRPNFDAVPVKGEKR